VQPVQDDAVAERVSFRGTIEPWTPGASGGLMVVVVPEAQARAMGGLRQMKVQGTLNGTQFASNTMPRGGGRLALSVSRAMMKAAGAAIGDEVDVEVEPR
jgi:hypothetical protein